MVLVHSGNTLGELAGKVASSDSLSWVRFQSRADSSPVARPCRSLITSDVEHCEIVLPPLARCRASGTDCRHRWRGAG